MEELQRLQSIRLKLLMKEQGITQKWLAEKFGFSETSVSHWVNGKVHMNDYNAKLISSEFPDYSPEYLRGYSEYRNIEQAERRTESLQQSIKRQNADAVELLAENSGFQVDFVSIAEEYGPDYPFRTDDDFGYKIGLGEKSIPMTAEDFGKFADEVSAYVAMRLSLMLERGCY